MNSHTPKHMDELTPPQFEANATENQHGLAPKLNSDLSVGAGCSTWSQHPFETHDPLQPSQTHATGAAGGFDWNSVQAAEPEGDGP